MRTRCRTVLTAVVVGTAMTLVAEMNGIALAQASAQGSAAIGKADISDEKGNHLVLNRVGGCRFNHRSDPRIIDLKVSDVLYFDDAYSDCGHNSDTAKTVRTRAGAKLFRLGVLQRWNGPKIELTDYEAACSADGDGSGTTARVGGVSGLPEGSVPVEIPANHTVTVPSPTAGDPPMARITFNKVGSTRSGGSSTDLMHVKLFPEGGPASGEVSVASVSCQMGG
ncbi:hypothetical protein [Goodfellowiella coeruleoviolacea]|uniref:Secreted protein n=1 Tax=Goodfellowiella coeruleoviolacea TaxID=334858 RepID=A0AAE3KPZ0_9PSEU|nr:hypothetical protein [Goodfellowiella coeruleoviolacea]MCP2170393.1 hypothetical protein [Goodfellowiella coeruleoviolacea]